MEKRKSEEIQRTAPPNAQNLGFHPGQAAPHLMHPSANFSDTSRERFNTGVVSRHAILRLKKL